MDCINSTRNCYRGMEITLAVILVQGNYFIHRSFRGIATSLGLLDLLRVAALLDNEIKDVEHGKRWLCSSRVQRGNRYVVIGFQGLSHSVSGNISFPAFLVGLLARGLARPPW